MSPAPDPHIHIGTSGWHYAHWQGPFYPEGMVTEQWLRHYAERFSCAEINNSFYRLPDAATFAAWREQTPAGFRFAVKAPRFITHMKKLKNCGEALDTFLSHASALQEKLGPILFQLPPRWHCNIARLETFLDALPRDCGCAFEFRDPSWHNAEVEALLQEHNAAFCIYDLARFQSPLTVTANRVYVRLHGPGEQPYTGSYRAPALRRWVDHIRGWRKQKKDVWVFLDNDEGGNAVRNSLRLKALLDGNDP